MSNKIKKMYKSFLGGNMSILYLTNKYYKLEKKYNTVIIKDKYENAKSFPIEKIDRIVIYGKKSISSQIIFEFLKRDISLLWFSKYGKLLGMLDTKKRINPTIHKRQFLLSENKDFSLNISKIFIISKIKNCRILLYKYNKKYNADFVSESISKMKKYISKIKTSSNKTEILGYEGNCAKLYFKSLNYFLPEEFHFTSRTKRPPKDPFNSLISFGYTILFYEIYTAIEYAGLNPYISFMHKARKNYPSLASDLIEELRSPIIDSAIVSSLRNKLFTIKDFDYLDKSGAVYLKNKSAKKLINIFENKINKTHKYYVFDKTFRESLLFQSRSLLNAIKEKNYELYKPLNIR